MTEQSRPAFRYGLVSAAHAPGTFEVMSSREYSDRRATAADSGSNKGYSWTRDLTSDEVTAYFQGNLKVDSTGQRPLVDIVQSQGDALSLIQIMYKSGDWAFSVMDLGEFQVHNAESLKNPNSPDPSLVERLTPEQAEAYNDSRLWIFSRRESHKLPLLAIADTNDTKYCLVSQGDKSGEAKVIPVNDYDRKEHYVWRLLTGDEAGAYDQGKLKVTPNRGQEPLVGIVKSEE